MVNENIKPLDNVERIAECNQQIIFEKYLANAKPVIIQNSQANAKIGQCKTQDDILSLLPDLDIQVQNNYTSQLRKDAVPKERGLSSKVKNVISDMKLKDYCAHIEQNPDTDLLCVECPSPQKVLDTLELPNIALPPLNPEQLVSFMFVANKGNYAHLHFDGDFRHVMLYQVFGRKRVVMVPTASLEKIHPTMNFSNLLLQNLPEDEKLDLLRYLGAYDCILEPGEAVIFPASIWHYIEYLDTGMSVNFRFGRDSFSKKLVDANQVPFYPELHDILTRIMLVKDDNEKADLQATLWHEIEPVLTASYQSIEQRHEATNALYRKINSQLRNDSTRKGPPVVPGYEEVTHSMAVERYYSYSQNKLRWREELMLGEPLGEILS
jgi:lysine-specific demethylase 8